MAHRAASIVQSVGSKHWKRPWVGGGGVLGAITQIIVESKGCRNLKWKLPRCTQYTLSVWAHLVTATRVQIPSFRRWCTVSTRKPETGVRRQKATLWLRGWIHSPDATPSHFLVYILHWLHIFSKWLAIPCDEITIEIFYLYPPLKCGPCSVPQKKMVFNLLIRKTITFGKVLAKKILFFGILGKSLALKWIAIDIL